MKMSREEGQEKILTFIRDEIQRKGYPPSVREICKAVGFKSTSSVHSHLRELEKQGILRRDATKPRAIEVCDTPKSAVVPLVGKVTAGIPILAQQNIEDELVVPESLTGNGEMFALRVEGESMIEAGILSGDIVMVEAKNDAVNGEIVVAMIDDEATVKRIFYEDDRIRLQPENHTMEPIYADDVTVLGKVVSLYRKF